MPTIRRAELSDAGELWTLQRAAWVTEAQVNDALWMPPLTETLDDIRAGIADHHGLVALDGTRIIGMVRGRADNGLWLIGRLGVAPDQQGRGLGKALLESIEAAAPETTDAYELFTGPLSVANIAFYERRGYRQVPSATELIHLRKDRKPA